MTNTKTGWVLLALFSFAACGGSRASESAETATSRAEGEARDEESEPAPEATEAPPETERPTPRETDRSAPPDPTPAAPTDSPAAARESAHVYWVGHSLVTHVDSHAPGTQPLDELVGELARAAGQRYDSYRHTIPGAPAGWNWGAEPRAYQESARELIAPLVDRRNRAYGTFDTMVVTEGVDIQATYNAWSPAFYARRFFCAARRANPSSELFYYESWHHFQATDAEFRQFYGPPEDWDFRAYMMRVHEVWTRIIDEASDPTRTPRPESYRYQGSGPDPGECDGILPIRLVPTGIALVRLLDRIREPREGDDLSYRDAARDRRLSAVDLFENPYLDFPQNRRTFHRGEVDDIHPSHLCGKDIQSGFRREWDTRSSRRRGVGLGIGLVQIGS